MSVKETKLVSTIGKLPDELSLDNKRSVESNPNREIPKGNEAGRLPYNSITNGELPIQIATETQNSLLHVECKYSTRTKKFESGHRKLVTNDITLLYFLWKTQQIDDEPFVCKMAEMAETLKTELTINVDLLKEAFEHFEEENGIDYEEIEFDLNSLPTLEDAKKFCEK